MGIYKDNMPDLDNNGHCFAPKLYKRSQNNQPQQTRGLSMLVSAEIPILGAKLALLGAKLALLGTKTALLGGKWHFYVPQWHFLVQKRHF